MSTGFTCIGLIVMHCFVTDQSPPPQSTVTVCPPVREWTKEFQAKLAKELKAAPKDSALATAAVQYVGDRKVARACAETKP